MKEVDNIKEVYDQHIHHATIDVHAPMDGHGSYNNNKEKDKGLGASPAPIPPH